MSSSLHFSTLVVNCHKENEAHKILVSPEFGT